MQCKSMSCTSMGGGSLGATKDDDRQWSVLTGRSPTCHGCKHSPVITYGPCRRTPQTTHLYCCSCVLSRGHGHGSDLSHSGYDFRGTRRRSSRRGRARRRPRLMLVAFSITSSATLQGPCGVGAQRKFFHLQACHRNRKNHIPGILQDGQWFTAEEAKQDLVYEYYNGILGTPSGRSHVLVLDRLLPQVDLTGIDACFSEAEIWATIKEMPLDRAPGPDGFSGAFYRASWEIIKDDVVRAFNALWSLDARSFQHINGALMVLLRKNNSPTTLKDYRPISLIHGFSKLFAKCLARRLAPRLSEIVAPN